MAIGSAFASGYGSGAKSMQQRSYMPIINALGNRIAQSKRGQGVRVSPSGRPSMEENRRARRLQEREDAAIQEEQWRHDEEQRGQQIAAAEKSEIMQAEEGRRAEAHELNQESTRQTQELAELNYTKAKSKEERKEAFQMVKEGLMMKNPQMLKTAFAALAPEAEDNIIEAEPLGDGVRTFRGRPGEPQVPQFIFDPDSDAVGVIFPGSDKPVAFKNTEQAFKNVVAPMNPEFEMSKEQLQERKSTREANLKSKELRSENHFKAHEAAMDQFKADGYYQPALFNQDQYDKVYAQHITLATGASPNEIPVPTEEEKRQGAQGGQEMPKGIYKGDQAPKGFPGARRGKNGGWYVKKGKGWAPIIGSKGKGKAKAKPKPKKQITKAGIDLPAGSEQATPAGRKIMDQMGEDRPTVIRKKVPKRPEAKQVPYKGKAKPAKYPDAQFNEKSGEWKYFDEESGEWKTVME